jgi:hypothetical protein
MIDTTITTADWAGTAISMWGVSPWAFVVLAGIIVLGLALKELTKNTKLTEALSMRIIDTGSIKATVEEIRKDQLVSNEQRQEHGKRLDAIDNRLQTVEKDVAELKCVRVACPSRDSGENG